MIHFDFRSPSKMEVTLEKAKHLEAEFLDSMGNFKSQFDDAESYIDYNVDTGTYTICCKKGDVNLIDRFNEYKKQNN